MNYLSVQFALFVVCLLLAYRLTPDRHKWKTLLFFSLLFYASSGWDKLVFVLGTSAVVYGTSREIEKIWRKFDQVCEASTLKSGEKRDLRKEYAKKSRRILLLGLIVCVGILCYCKFALRAVALVNRIGNTSIAIKVIVPLGVSYYTFSAVGYLLDIHWRKTKVCTNYLKLLLCMIYFPHIVEGPISRYEKLLPQFESLSFPDYRRFTMGLQLMLWGLIKKMVIADRLVIFVQNVFNNVEQNEGLTFLVALFFGAFWMYTDFSGCMDLVTGMSEILGVKLERNFWHPFFSQTAGEFWRRWHITLGAWFKDYIYIPMTTSSLTRKLRRTANRIFGDMGSTVVMTVVPLMTVWLLTGIWHGTGWSYVVWGLYWGVLICCGDLFGQRFSALSKKLGINTASHTWKIIRILRTFCLYMGGCLAVFPDSLGNSLLALKKMFSVFNPWIFWDYSLYTHGLDQRNFFFAIFSIIVLLFADSLQERIPLRETLSRKHILIRWCVYYAGLFAVLVFGIYGPGYNAQDFVYMQF